MRPKGGGGGIYIIPLFWTDVLVRILCDVGRSRADLIFPFGIMDPYGCMNHYQCNAMFVPS